jgi:hypothetical protein
MSISMDTQYHRFGEDVLVSARACHNEFDILQHVRVALRRALNWDVQDTGFTQKLCSVRFALKSLDRHLQRMIELEERGGYMAVVGDKKPHLHERAVTLQAEHDQLRSQFSHVMSSFESLPNVVALTASQQEQFQSLCGELDDLLARLDQHEVKETDLMQEVLLCDEGGEG